MPFDPHSFWEPKPAKNPPLTDAMVADAERRLGVRLPQEFVALLRLKNGGETRGFDFPTTQAPTMSPDRVSLEELNGIGGADAEIGCPNILDRDMIVRECGLPPTQIPLTGSGHWYITLDYRRGPSPSVAFMDLEMGQECQLAESFAAFLDGLRPWKVRNRRPTL